MVKYGQITDKNNQTGRITVRFSRPEACGSCKACGTGSGNSEVSFPSEHNIGEWVRVELPENRFVQATTLVYIIPLVGLFLGLLLGWLIAGSSDLVMVVSAVAGLLVAFVILYLIDKFVSKKPEWTPVITAVYPEKPSESGMDCGVS